MLTPGRARLGEPWTCARCERPPGHVDDLEAFAAGHTSSRRELHGAPVFTVCAACVRIEAHEVYRGNIAYWTGLGGESAAVVAMLTRPL